MRRYGVLSLALVFTLTMIVGGFLINASLATPQKGEQTAFEKKCSVCHTLERVKTEIEIMIKEMHDKAGIEVSDAELVEI